MSCTKEKTKKIYKPKAYINRAEGYNHHLKKAGLFKTVAILTELHHADIFKVE